MKVLKLDLTSCLTITLIILITLYIIILMNKHSSSIIENINEEDEEKVQAIIDDAREAVDNADKKIDVLQNAISGKAVVNADETVDNSEYISFNDIVNKKYNDMETIEIRNMDNIKNNTLIEKLKKLRNELSQIPFNDENLNNIKKIISYENEAREEDNKITHFTILYSGIDENNYIAKLSLGKSNITNNDLTVGIELKKTDNGILLNRGREELKFITFINKNNYTESDNKYKSTTKNGNKCLSWVDSNPSGNVLNNDIHGIFKKMEDSDKENPPIIYSSNICSNPDGSDFNWCYINSDTKSKNRWEKC